MSLVYKAKIANWEWYEAESVVSTNDTIKEMLPIYGKDIVISAISQTGGRGRRGRSWQEKKGNLYFTYGQEAPAYELSRIVCLVGLSLAKVIKRLDSKKDVKIKWPNDVFLEGKKVSGILIENIGENLWGIGIGVNVKESPNLKGAPYKATSLRECGINLDRTELMQYYLEQFSTDMKAYQDKGFSELKEQWKSMAKNFQGKIKIKAEKGIKRGIFKDIDDNGYLILSTEEGEERIIAGDLFI